MYNGVIQHTTLLKGFTMFSKFDDHISSEELVSYEPTQADWEEYNAFLEEQEAGEPLPEPEDFNAFDGHLDLYHQDDPNPYPQEPWEDDYTDLDAVDMYGAEWENDALRGWD